MNIVFRLAEQQDIPKLGKLFSQVYTDKNFDNFTPEASTEYLGWLFERCPGLAFVAEEDGEIRGAYLAALKPWWDGPHVVDGEIFVTAEYRKRGLGRRLTEILLKTAQEKYGAVEVEAITFAYEPKVIEWHAKNARNVVPELVFISGTIVEVLKATTEKSRTN